MSADADIVNSALAGKRSFADQIRASGDYNKPKTPTPVEPAARPTPLPNAQDGELNWVQRMAKQVHDYFVKQKSVKKAAAAVATKDTNDVNNLNNTSSTN